MQGNYLQLNYAVFDAVYFDSCRNDAARHQSAKASLLMHPFIADNPNNHARILLTWKP